MSCLVSLCYVHHLHNPKLPNDRALMDLYPCLSSVKIELKSSSSNLSCYTNWVGSPCNIPYLAYRVFMYILSSKLNLELQLVLIIFLSQTQAWTHDIHRTWARTQPQINFLWSWVLVPQYLGLIWLKIPLERWSKI